ncbi:TetR/AcrR family transcriptional regulator [filamentous cyanobacterium LEGE 11480]|uniref:TetR/AcrR family transcriptional regulator n=1 Tax=Romeriopsis navalis LEGE 11480 TaxID=2777977 RepID=A0A928Z695_9CYAN|nr:TetR/AcrR family transcriptional regulator [Romeriopsis navalis]MBE9032030.1 TetR/AcrR family transcriptional regulator [Romeriopsis navalis LEGE 11480]
MLSAITLAKLEQVALYGRSVLPIVQLPVSIRSYHHGHLRDALLTAALAQISEEGAQALNLSKLARQVGVSQPAVYRHFANKQALTFSLVELGFERLLAQLQVVTPSLSPTETPTEDQPDLRTAIAAIAQTYIRFALENRELARLMFSLKERATEPILYKVSKQAAGPLFLIVKAGQARYGLKVQSPEQAVRLMWSTMHGLAVLLMDEQLPYVTQTPGEIEVHTTAIAQMLFEGLFLRPSP